MAIHCCCCCLQKEHSNKDEFSHLMWETQKTRVIKAGSPEKLVEFLYNKGEMDSSYVNVFFATYRTFSSTQEVLDLLINRYSYIFNSAPLVIFHAILWSADFLQNQLFRKILTGIPSECQTLRIQIRLNNLLCLIWVQTVCKGYQQMTLGHCSR